MVGRAGPGAASHRPDRGDRVANGGGLAANSVLAIELVTAQGQLVRADHESEPDLLPG